MRPQQKLGYQRGGESLQSPDPQSHGHRPVSSGSLWALQKPHVLGSTHLPLSGREDA